MKTIGVVLALCLLGGCGTYHTMEELEHQAFLSGDWSPYEHRERQIASRRQRAGVACPSGLMLYCIDRGGDRRCSCESSEDFREILGGWR